MRRGRLASFFLEKQIVNARSLIRAVFLVLLVTSSGLLGCSKATQEFAEVDGTVTLNGKALPNVEVVFMGELQDEKGKANPASTGYTDDHGHYSLWCGTGRYTKAPWSALIAWCVNDIAAMPLPAMEFGDDPAAARAQPSRNPCACLAKYQQHWRQTPLS